MHTLMNNSLVMSGGIDWMKQRRIVRPQIHRQRLAMLTELMVHAIDEALVSWERSADLSTFNVAPAFNELTLKVLSRTLFGKGPYKEEMNKVLKALDYTMNYILRAIILSSWPSWVPLGRKKFEKSIRQIDETVYQMIADGCNNNGAENHLIAMLLDTVDDETSEGLTEQELRDEVITLLLAGFEICSNALAWACDFLTHRPDVMEKLHAEVDAVLGDRLPTFNDLMKLRYSRMVLHETLSLRPSVWQLPRIATQDEEVDRQHSPAGMTLISMLHACHYHPDEGQNPGCFQPEKPANPRKFAYLPFGIGERSCIGKDFVLMEGQLALAMIAQRYTLTKTSESLAQPQLFFALQPKGGVRVKLEKRS